MGALKFNLSLLKGGWVWERVRFLFFFFFGVFFQFFFVISNIHYQFHLDWSIRSRILFPPNALDLESRCNSSLS
jgi:hypothetical protein